MSTATQPEAQVTPRRLLLQDPDPERRRALAIALSQAGYAVSAVATLEQAEGEIERRPCDALVPFVDELGAGADLPSLRRLRERAPHAIVVVLGAAAPSEVAPAAVAAGADDYLRASSDGDELVVALRKCELRARDRRASPSTTPPPRAPSLAELVAASAPMQEVMRVVRKVADVRTTVLITGESGTGKERIARAIHELSSRRDAPFVAVNCCAIPETLLESELFGHRKGAFTDAWRDRPGRFEEASGGTLFLDEIGDLPAGIQVKLLRVLQEQEVRPLGATGDVRVDVRVVAATLRNLPDEVAKGRFREDLFYRLNVVGIHLPPLRDRREEIPALLEQVIARTNRKLGTHVGGLTPDAERMLLAYGWPGNVRELENTIERAMVLAEGARIEVGELPDKLREPQSSHRISLGGGELSIKKVTRYIEEELIRRALRETGGNRTNAAKILEISHRALLYKIKEYAIED